MIPFKMSWSAAVLWSKAATPLLLLQGFHCLEWPRCFERHQSSLEEMTPWGTLWLTPLWKKIIERNVLYFLFFITKKNRNYIILIFFSYIYFENLWMGNLHDVFAYFGSNAVKRNTAIKVPSKKKENKLIEGLCTLKNKAKKNTSINRNIYSTQRPMCFLLLFSEAQ